MAERLGLYIVHMLAWRATDFLLLHVLSRVIDLGCMGLDSRLLNSHFLLVILG